MGSTDTDSGPTHSGPKVIRKRFSNAASQRGSVIRRGKNKQAEKGMKCVREAQQVGERQDMQ